MVLAVGLQTVGLEPVEDDLADRRGFVGVPAPETDGGVEEVDEAEGVVDEEGVAVSVNAPVQVGEKLGGQSRA